MVVLWASKRVFYWTKRKCKNERAWPNLAIHYFLNLFNYIFWWKLSCKPTSFISIFLVFFTDKLPTVQVEISKKCESRKMATPVIKPAQLFFVQLPLGSWKAGRFLVASLLLTVRPIVTCGSRVSCRGFLKLNVT